MHKYGEENKMRLKTIKIMFTNFSLMEVFLWSGWRRTRKLRVCLARFGHHRFMEKKVDWGGCFTTNNKENIFNWEIKMGEWRILNNEQLYNLCLFTVFKRRVMRSSILVAHMIQIIYPYKIWEENMKLRDRTLRTESVCYFNNQMNLQQMFMCA
jgi:hypothetical protein